MRTILIALLYGIVQGITEWLPISSTGHMLLLDTMLPLPMSADFRGFFLVAVQLGSLAALIPRVRVRIDLRQTENRRLWGRVLAASLPAALCGLLFDDLIESRLSSPAVIAGALAAYGVAFLCLGRGKGSITDPARLPLGRVLGVGAAQALALIPGTSRSGATMLGGALLGLTPACAAEFSFLLAMPTMLGAAGLKAVKLALSLVQGAPAPTPAEWVILAAASAAAFAVSCTAIRFLLDFVTRRGFAAFGIYRIALAAVVLCAHLGGWV